MLKNGINSTKNKNLSVKAKSDNKAEAGQVKEKKDWIGLDWITKSGWTTVIKNIPKYKGKVGKRL